MVSRTVVESVPSGLLKIKPLEVIKATESSELS